MLERLWLRLGRLAARVSIVLIIMASASWAISSIYRAWEFSGPVSAEEQIPPNEAALTQSIIADAIRIADQHRDNTRVLRDAHAKAHGCVKAQFKVLQTLTPELRHGVLSDPGRVWQAWIRLSNGNALQQFDRVGDARGMAIKLLDVPGEKLLRDSRGSDTQDFVMINHPVFFIRDAAEFQQFFAAKAQGERVLAFFPSWDPRSWELRHLIIALQTLAAAPESPVSTVYHSITPFKLGPHNIKYRVIPIPENCPSYQQPELNRDLPNFLRSALKQQLSLDRVPACLALQVQRQNTSYYMPIEDPSVPWDESIAPFETVATITIPPQDFDNPQQNLFCDNLSFNTWHSLPAHRPIGGINRIRKAVYQAVSDFRHQQNGAN
ncbi:catalase family protein [Ectopseudomonas hydrolytica]|uniref:catalase family protein n=1 Tax=Ectopseudomonas hydrolytica TaxID=2493633 RepID=UPI0018A78868|nr:catalase family protein [Pseudomonas hydrolytica]MBF8159890.1 catalase family protein [Pseudomonas mendocina]UTH32344.1 catalase family protein [Pseudomonas hydrolytica]UZZ11534.1 catalase family protein [Pseudomonas mendocina]